MGTVATSIVSVMVKDTVAGVSTYVKKVTPTTLVKLKSYITYLVLHVHVHKEESPSCPCPPKQSVEAFIPVDKNMVHSCLCLLKRDALHCPSHSFIPVDGTLN